MISRRFRDALSGEHNPSGIRISVVISLIEPVADEQFQTGDFAGVFLFFRVPDDFPDGNLEFPGITGVLTAFPCGEGLIAAVSGVGQVVAEFPCLAYGLHGVGGGFDYSHDVTMRLYGEGRAGTRSADAFPGTAENCPVPV